MNVAPRFFTSAACAIALLQIATGVSQAITVRDARGREVQIHDASRIVSIGGAVTEILYALGRADLIVGVDSTSMHPVEALKTKPNVGYYRQLSPEGVLSLGPSLILAAEGSGPKETVSVLEAAAIPFVRIPDTYDGKGIVDKIRIVAAATDSTQRGECLAKRVETDLSSLAALRDRIKSPVKVMFVMSFAGGKPMVAGRGTAADGLIKLAGGVNVFGDFEGYKVVNEEAVVGAAPDWVLGMQRPGLDLTETSIFSKPAFSMTPAARRKQFFSMDGLYMLGFGPRTARAATDLSRVLYPDLKSGVLPAADDDAQACKI
ncbi:MAG: heme/hemin ABC transporter substrate-binding protein [Pseudorhodoplanes sp.]